MRKTACGIALAVLLAGCGSSTRTTTVTATAAKTAVATNNTFVSRNAPTTGPYLAQPTYIDFSVDGDLQAKDLRWTGWGSSVAVGEGTFLFRDSPSSAVDAVPGTVTLSEPTRCNGKLYYTTGVVNAPGGPFTPTSPTFSSPCAAAP